MSDHIPVLLEEFLQYFKEEEIVSFFDGTIGAGGHAKALLENHPEIEKYIACDVDPSSMEKAKKTLRQWEKKILWVQGNYRNIDQYLQKLQIDKVDGAFFDIGVSSMHFDDPAKGFSFSKEGFLDMRMDPTLRTTAYDIVNRFSEKKLTEIFKEYGEERKSHKAARAIMEYRRKKKIQTTKELADLLKGVCFKKPRLHPATLVFQALRIYVNDELRALEEGIEKAIDCLQDKKRIGVISFHSLEDRIVKNTFRKWNRKKGIILTKKPITATRQEVRNNPRARSAKMRFFEKGI